METLYTTSVRQIGTSYGVIIPKNILDAYHWARGDMLLIGFAGQERLFFKKVDDNDIKNLRGGVPINFN